MCTIDKTIFPQSTSCSKVLKPCITLPISDAARVVMANGQHCLQGVTLATILYGSPAQEVIPPHSIYMSNLPSNANKDYIKALLCNLDLQGDYTTQNVVFKPGENKAIATFNNSESKLPMVFV